MKQKIIIFFVLMSIIGVSQVRNNKIILFDYSYQIPSGALSKNFGHNSAIGLTYLQNKNNFLYGLDASFMFGNNIKNDSILRLIATNNGYLINSSGELDDVLLYERGINAHILVGRSFCFEEGNITGIYTYAGIGYLEHQIKMETDRTNLPQIDDNYKKGYDNFTNGLSTKMSVDYIYSDKKTSIKIHLATDFIYALTKNRRAYSFSEMEEYNKDIRKEILFGLRFGVIIPINRNNPEKFYYR